ncbi:MAG: glycerophosphodiester phosphodiesterase [Clostridiales bacterium]|nr:glycerophosphodiester phosphodiesterase [Clostridiales bacterium]
MTNIIAHRGANKYAPQNTVPAFQKAVELGCDGFENDVHLTKDGYIVICHNYDIDATSDGKGFIADYTLNELLKFDFGSYFSEDFKGTKIPRLEEFLDLCGGLKVINIEIKSPQRGHNDIASKTIKMVKDFGLFDNLIISSFDPEILKECKEIDPKVKTGLLYEPNEEKCDAVCADPVAYAKNIKADALHPFYGFVTEEYIEDAHKAGIMVNPWTVDQDFAMENLYEWNCDGVITNMPDFAREVLNKTLNGSNK